MLLGKDGKRQFNGLIDVYKQTLASDGIGGLYRGFVISCVGIFIYRGLYFGIYDTVKPIMIGDGGSFLASFALGWAVTVVSGLASYPIDTVRRRMMMTSGTGKLCHLVKIVYLSRFFKVSTTSPQWTAVSRSSSPRVSCP